nr:hypothetical protein CFP56_58065 [Quercus suber]
MEIGLNSLMLAKGLQLTSLGMKATCIWLCSSKDVNGRVFEEHGVEVEDMGFLLRGPRTKAEVDVGTTEHGVEADGGGEDYEEENAE